MATRARPAGHRRFCRDALLVKETMRDNSYNIRQENQQSCSLDIPETLLRSVASTNRLNIADY